MLLASRFEILFFAMPCPLPKQERRGWA
jgi:hypothetical protein